MPRHTVRALAAGALSLLVCGCSPHSATGQPAPLVLERTIPLPDVGGRIDHLALDSQRNRLFVAALGNGTVEAVDLAAGKVAGRIGGLAGPQGIGVLPDRGELVVASGGDGSVRFYREDDLSPVGQLALGSDADDVRVDAAARRIVVGYGSGALAVIDPARRLVVGRVPLPAHPEGFQIEGRRAFVNLPDARQVGVADLAAGRLMASWPDRGRRFNFPLALDGATGEVAVVYRLPARLVTFDAATGAERQAVPTCGDADDLFFDARRGRIYVACGGGAVDVFERHGATLERRARMPTSNGARTALFSPDLDRLFVAARAEGGHPAAIMVFRPQ